MAKELLTIEQALAEIEDLRTRLEEAEEGLNAIKSGEVDAVIVSGPEGEQIYTLSGAEHTYRILVEAMNEGALVLSSEGVIVYCNRTFAAMLAAPIYEVLGHAIYEFVADADVAPLRKMLQQAPMRVGRKEISLKHNDSGSIPAFVSVGNLETEDGPAVSAVVTDLTETKRTEAELTQYREHLEELVMERTKELAQANEHLRVEIEQRKCTEDELAQARIQAEGWAAQLESFVTSIADGVTLFDASGNVVMMNDAGKAMFGVPPDEPFDDWPRYRRYTLDGELIPVDDTASFRALRGEFIRDMQYKVVSPWGKGFIMSVSASPVRDSEGRIIGATNIFRDISDQVEFEQQRQELYEREHKIAEMLQQALIPSQIPYNLQNVSVAARYQPAMREAEVGGDFYDVFKLDKNKIGVLIGDIAGKGLNAAMRVAEIRHAVRSYAYLGHSPSTVMTLANEALLQEAEDMAHLLTAFFAVVDTVSGKMTYACAGHEPPLVCNSHSSIEELNVTGAMLGVARGIKYLEEIRNLNPGDTVVMFTDGITEARHDGSILFEKVGVIDQLTKLCDARPDEIAEALLEAATLHAGGSLQDDVAIVVLEFDKLR